MKTIRCGVVGVGYLGQHHARIYSELPGCELVGILDANPERAAEIAVRYGCRVFDSVEALGQACDAISVAVPTDRHYAVALPLLEMGRHLLVEKPLCVALHEATQLVDAAQKQRCLLQVGHIEHYNPVMEFLEKAVHTPRFITADRLAPFNMRGTEVGVVMDLMIHDIGIILQLVRSPIKSIEAVGVRVLSETEDIANARLVFENGCIANLNTSRVSMKKTREIRVFQPFTYLSLDFMNQTGHLIRKEANALQQEEIPIQKGEPLLLELRSFTDCVRRYDEPKVNASLGCEALRIAIAVTDKIRKELY